jgi:hypothetical protein
MEQIIIEEPMEQINSSTQITKEIESQPDSESDSSDSEPECTVKKIENSEPECKAKKIEKKVIKKAGAAKKEPVCKKKKIEKKAMIHGVPKKIWENLLKKEIERSASKFFAKMSKEPVPESGAEKKNGEAIHKNISCDGCGKMDFIGTRYKCSVCKNFDYCSACEESKPHDHAFLKIKDPSQVPLAIFCSVDDSMPNVKADIDMNVDGSFGAGFPFGCQFQGMAEHP